MTCAIRSGRSPSTRRPHPTSERLDSRRSPRRRRLIRAAVNGLSDRQLDTPYRPDGWTVRQVRAPRARQPRQRLLPLQARADRRQADHQGRTTRRPGRSVADTAAYAARHVAGAARRAAPALGDSARVDDGGRFRAPAVSTRNAVRSTSTGCCSCMPGTAGITPRMSRRCAREGKSDWAEARTGWGRLGARPEGRASTPTATFDYLQHSPQFSPALGEAARERQHRHCGPCTPAPGTTPRRPPMRRRRRPPATASPRTPSATRSAAANASAKARTARDAEHAEAEQRLPGVEADERLVRLGREQQRARQRPGQVGQRRGDLRRQPGGR